MIQFIFEDYMLKWLNLFFLVSFVKAVINLFCDIKLEANKTWNLLQRSSIFM